MSHRRAMGHFSPTLGGGAFWCQWLITRWFL